MLEKCLDNFMRQSAILENEYLDAMRQLSSVPDMVPKEQWQRDKDEIRAKIAGRMNELGDTFKVKMEALADEFMEKVMKAGGEA